MIMLGIGLAIATLSLLRYAARLAMGTGAINWPEETPLNLHDNRARDPHLAYLSRLLSSETLEEAHHGVIGVTERLLTSGSVTLHIDSVDEARTRLGPTVATFLADPPLDNPQRYRRALSEVLTRVEGL